MQSPLLPLLALATVLFAVPAYGEPPPRSERAPPSDGPDSGPPPFQATAWTPGYPVPSAWTPRYFHYETRYTASVADDELVFETFADGTASWIARSLPQDLAAKPDECLNWRWSADQLPDLTQPEDSLKGDDFAARVYLFGAFENGDAFGFNYVWSQDKPAGESWKSPWSDNRLLSLRRGAGHGGAMVAESRAVAADIERAYGRAPARINGIALMTDAEGSGGVAAARISLPRFGACNALVG